VRSTLGSAMWPVPNPAPTRPASRTRDQSAQHMKSLPPECEKNAKQSLRAETGAESIDFGEVRHALAPGEPDGGWRLLMVRSPDTTLNFFLLALDAGCTSRSLFTMTVAPNSDIETDTDLRLIAVNSKSGEQYGRTWLYRLDWIRQCRHDAGKEPCKVPFFSDWVPTIHPKGPYHVVDASHIRIGDQLYQLGRDSYKATVLTGDEAKRAREAFAANSAGTPRSDDAAICDRRGPYVAVMKGSIGTLRILTVKGDRPCQDYADERTAIMTFDLRSYSIGGLAFAKKEASSTGAADDVPDHIYLQSGESDVVYSLVWKPETLRSTLCDAMRKQNGNRIPQFGELPTSAQVLDALVEQNESEFEYVPIVPCE